MTFPDETARRRLEAVRRRRIAVARAILVAMTFTLLAAGAVAVILK